MYAIRSYYELPGLQARLMSQALRKLTSSISRSRTMVLFINQLRMKIGVMFGSPETTTGGRALKFYASVRMDIRRIGSIKEGADGESELPGASELVELVGWRGQHIHHEAGQLVITSYSIHYTKLYDS